MKKRRIRVDFIENREQRRRGLVSTCKDRWMHSYAKRKNEERKNAELYNFVFIYNKHWHFFAIWNGQRKSQTEQMEDTGKDPSRSGFPRRQRRCLAGDAGVSSQNKALEVSDTGSLVSADACSITDLYETVSMR